MNKPHCGPCSGDCRQGRDCPWPDNVPRQPAEACTELGHDDALESMLAHRRLAALVRWAFALLVLLAAASYIPHP